MGSRPITLLGTGESGQSSKPVWEGGQASKLFVRNSSDKEVKFLLAGDRETKGGGKCMPAILGGRGAARGP